MKEPSKKSAIDAAAARLRSIVLEAEDGTLVGSEEHLLQTLGFSRSTVRQVARMLEQEGLLKVKRGIGGGYYAARPDARTIERTVSTYLETVQFNGEDITLIASALWIEVVRKAVRAPREAAAPIVTALMDKVNRIKPTTSIAQVRLLERESQNALMSLAQSPYIQLIFDINVAFASRTFPQRDLTIEGEGHEAFVRNWRQAKLLELAAILQGDEELGIMAARYVRAVWHKHIWLPAEVA